MHDIKSDGRNCWLAEGEIDDEIMRVPLYGEHRRAIKAAGYKVTWGKHEIAVIDAPVVLLMEVNGRRRIAAVLKKDTNDTWIEVKQAKEQTG